MDTTARSYDEFPGPTTRIDEERITVAAVFPDRESAHDAVHHLHEEGFRETWIGLVRNDELVDDASRSSEVGLTAPAAVRIEADNWFTRFFGEGDESLSEALTRHGVSEADARAAGPLPAFGAILTVDGTNHPELAAQIITEDGGRVITRGFGATGYGTTGHYGIEASEAPEMRTTSLVEDGAMGVEPQAPLGSASSAPANDGLSTAGTMPDDYGRYRAGTPIDESTRLQLRAERLRIDKSLVSRGEATVGTEIVSETQSFDVPIIREELFIERRPVSATAVNGTVTPIGETATVTVPLMEEKLVVTKEAVVTEEVVIGKRQVADTAHVSETTRAEQLRVDDSTLMTERDPLTANVSI